MVIRYLNFTTCAFFRFLVIFRCIGARRLTTRDRVRLIHAWTNISSLLLILNTCINNSADLVDIFFITRVVCSDFMERRSSVAREGTSVQPRPSFLASRPDWCYPIVSKVVGSLHWLLMERLQTKPTKFSPDLIISLF